MTLPADVYHGRPADDAPDPHVAVIFRQRDVTCDMVDALSVSGGRSDKMAQADPATAAMTLRWDPADPMPQIGDEVRVVGWAPATPRGASNPGIPLFHGDITDIAVEDVMVSLVAAEPIRWLDAAFVGDTPWPAELLLDRIERIARAAAAALGVAWIPDPLLSPVETTQPWASHPCRPLDVDHRRAKELLEKSFNVGLASMYYKLPDTVDPADDATFTGHLAPVPGIVVDIKQLNPPYHGVPCRFIGGDPVPRFWQNLTSVVNQWNVKGWEYDSAENDYVEAAGVATDAGSRDLYGARGGEADTMLDDKTNNSLQDRADALLAVTKDVQWCADNIVCYVTRSTLAPGRSAQYYQTMELAGSPGRHGQAWYVDLYGTDSTNHAGMPLVMIESKQVDWRPDGWQITLAVSHPLMYDVTFTGLGPDPTGRPVTGRQATLLDLHNYEPTTLQALADRPSNTLAELDRDVNAWLP